MKTKLWQAIVAVALAALILLPLVACGDTSAKPAETAGNSAEVSTGVSTGATGNETATAPVTPEPTPEPIPEPTPEPDPYAVLEVSEEWARSNMGVYLKRGDKFYSLSGSTNLEKAMLYDIGCERYGTSVLWDYTDGGVVSHGDVPVIVVEDGDEFVDFFYKDARVYEYVFSGYSLDIVKDPQNSSEYLKIFAEHRQADVVTRKDYNDTFEVRDENGNVMDEYTNLEQGKTYTVSWFEGMNYHEWEMTADCRYYVEVDHSDTWGWAKVAGEMHREGYASFDLSQTDFDIPEGVYSFGRGLFWTSGF